MESHFLFTKMENIYMQGNATINGTINANSTHIDGTGMTRTLIFYMTIYCLVIFLVIVLNSITIISLKPYQSRRRSNIEVLILYLSTFDMMASIMLIVDVYESITMDFRLGAVGCKLIYPIYQISLNMSICILMIMSVDRCRSVSFTVKTKFSKCRVHLAVFTALFISMIMQTYQFVALHENKDGNCMRDRSTLSFGIPRLIITVLRDIVLLIVILVTSAVIYKALKNNDVFNSYTKEKKEKVMGKIKMIIVMELVFAVLVIPYDIFDSVLQTFTIQHVQFDITDTIMNVDSVLTILQMSNSFANFFVYAKMYHYLATTRNTANFEEHTTAKTDTMDVQRTNHGYSHEL